MNNKVKSIEKETHILLLSYIICLTNFLGSILPTVLYL